MNITGTENRQCPKCGHVQPWFAEGHSFGGVRAWTVIRYCNNCEHDFHPEYSRGPGMTSNPEPREESFPVDAQKHVEPAPASPAPKVDDTLSEFDRECINAAIARVKAWTIGAGAIDVAAFAELATVMRQRNEARRLAEEWRADAYGEFPRDVVMTRLPWEK